MLPLANIFQPLIDFFEAILKFLHDSVGISWGFSIITLTILIRGALVPLTLKQFRSMHALQRLQPQMKALQTKYKGDKARLNEEMMKFYKEHKVNPFASCLPMVAQLPVFISLFYMLRKDLRFDICHQTTKACSQVPGPHDDPGFLFVHDLTGAATGSVLVILIVLYVGSTVGSTLLMSVTADKTQRNIMLFLPLIFVTFIIQFPAGVIVYWITTNFWTIVQGYIVKKRLGPMPVMPVEEGGGLGGMLARAMGREPAVAEAGSGRPTKRGAEPVAAEASGGTKPTGKGGGASKARAGGGKTSAGGGKATAGGGKASAGATKASGNGSKATGEAAPRPSGKAPPPSPRKKKKRSGRRR